MCPEAPRKVAHLGSIDHLRIGAENWPAFTERIEEAVVEEGKQQVF